MSDEYYSDSDPASQPIKAPSRKRKTAASGTSTAKKAKVVSNSNGGILNKEISEIASSITNYGVDFFTDSETQEDPVHVAKQLARYIQQLENALAEAKSSSGAPAAKQKTRAELEAAAEKIRRAAVSGITKQMTVRVPSFRP